MTIDCFSVYNELDMMELRLRELDATVDHFIAVQGEETHAGVVKPMYVDPEDARWAPWTGRLSTVSVPRIQTANRWVREKEMRHVKGPALAAYAPDDVVILSCVDEIPDVSLFPGLIPQLSLDRWVGFNPPCYYYYLNLRTHRSLPAIQLARVDTLRKYGADLMETMYRRPPIGPLKAGWHFSYLGGVEAIRQKFASFAHAEYDTEYFKNPQWLAARIQARLNPFDRDEPPYRVVPLAQMPREVREHPERYAAWLLPEDSA